MLSLNVLTETLSAQINTERPCGSCTVCCTVLAVCELGKPYYTKCHNLTTKCNIYQERPGSCSGYECVWRMGFLGNDPALRPDTTGLLFSIDDDRHGAWLEVFEVVTGALQLANLDIFIDDLYANIGDLRGIRLYHLNDKIGLTFPINPIYPDHQLSDRYRTFMTQDNVHFIYSERDSLRDLPPGMTQVTKEQA